jgi:hypothetical protein
MKLGESGDMGRRNIGGRDEGDIGNDCRVGVGVADGLSKNVGDMGDMPTAHIDPIGETTNPGEIVRSNIDKGDAGMRGDAIRKNDCACGGTRKGLMGDDGCSNEKGEGVSGSQYDSVGTGGVHDIIQSDESDVLHGSGEVARRGVEGRGTHQEIGWMVREAEAGRRRILNE